MTDRNTSGEAPVSLDGVKQKKASALEQKRAAARDERRRRLLNQGVPEEKVDLVMAQQDWALLPVEKKLELFMERINHSFGMVAQDLGAVRENQGNLADSMDVNFRAFQLLLLEKLGITPEDIQGALQRAEATIVAEQQAAQAQWAQQQQAQAEADQMGATLKDAESLGAPGVDAPGTPVVPEEATQFGG